MSDQPISQRIFEGEPTTTPLICIEISALTVMPYERFEYVVVATEGEFYDWPLKVELQLPTEAAILPKADNAPRNEASQSQP